MILYVTQLKDNVLNIAKQEFDIPDDAQAGVLKNEVIKLSYVKNTELKHITRRIAFGDGENVCVFEFITNNFDLSAE